MRKSTRKPALAEKKRVLGIVLQVYGTDQGLPISPLENLWHYQYRFSDFTKTELQIFLEYFLLLHLSVFSWELYVILMGMEKVHQLPESAGSYLEKFRPEFLEYVPF